MSYHYTCTFYSPVPHKEVEQWFLIEMDEAGINGVIVDSIEPLVTASYWHVRFHTDHELTADDLDGMEIERANIPSI